MIKTLIIIIVSVIVGYLISHFNILNFVISSLIEVTVINNKKVIVGAIVGQALIYFFVFFLPLSSVANQIVKEESSTNYRVNPPKTPSLVGNLYLQQQLQQQQQQQQQLQQQQQQQQQSHHQPILNTATPFTLQNHLIPNPSIKTTQYNIK
ncbi:hypothetical protein DDB_G0277665 [Dictyostelium discoideum AX4]|uniref:Putative transmembrane protein DDB_G0277665 n=1 Tax=Dictyostelium discoideum TaxID=44689 RepID=Y8005_DICDI|nr:hypothetical protein DDB_G0277665 [Dictyostelium discoideum AX4]Q86KL7.1 RecName: Full=Putative transmembrane protein DDB_G0277665 [Dictyostelium discoideum]EAL68650.1 hypothetical protein DDB_G0277665 [Dictyostelium discoideum AX4]|eukprot:XP_642563.1 hypothetical protein DDB_G0277665 [Dictyostelium discoideum AX4]